MGKHENILIIEQKLQSERTEQFEEKKAVNEAQAMLGSSQLLFAFLAFSSDIIECQWHSSELTGIYCMQ